MFLLVTFQGDRDIAKSDAGVSCCRNVSVHYDEAGKHRQMRTSLLR